MSGSQILELPCLGRPFHLGMLYNCHSHHLISDYIIPEDVLSSEVKMVKSNIQSSPEFYVTSEETVSSKLSVLHTSSNSFKLGVVTGLIKKSGAAEYFDDRKSSNNVTRVSLLYKQETAISKLDIDDIKQKFTSLCRYEATHVVVGLIYGRESFFVFDKKIDIDSWKEDQRGELQQELQTIVKGMTSNTMQAIPDKDKVSMHCSFYGKFLTRVNTSSFDNASECFRKIIDNSETSLQIIPLQVQLLPLTFFDVSALNLGKKLTTPVTKAIMHMIDELHDITLKCNSFIQKDTSKQYTGVLQQVMEFREFVKQYESQLFSSIAEVQPRVCSGELEESQLQEFATQRQTSPFSFKTLSAWLKNKEKEIEHVDRLLTSLKKIPDIEFIHSLDDLNDIVESIDYDSIVSLEFTISDQSDDTLHLMSAYLHSQSSDYGKTCLKSWMEDETLKAELRSIVKQFKTLATGPSEQGKKFIVSTCSNFKHSKEAVAVIVQYFEGKPMMFHQTSPPGEPKFKEVSSENVQVYWEEPQTGREHVESYVVSYQSNNDSWFIQEIDGKQTYATIENLEEDTLYNFKVQAKTKSGMSEESKESSIKTQSTPKAPSQPGKPLYTKVTHESVHLEWTKPDQGAHLVSQYVVHYKEDKRGGKRQWEEIETRSVSEEFTVIGLLPVTAYRFKVFAKYKRKLSAPSDVSDPISTTKKPLKIHIRDSSWSHRISDGIPKLYQLKPKYTTNDKQKCIAKCHIGILPNRRHCQERVLLVVGATGAGKSTLINAITNYVLGVKWEDNFRFQLVSNKKGKSQAHSQTEWITAYTFHWQKDVPFSYSLTVIDTPGFGDTRGLERDQHITTQIKEFFSFPVKDGINHLHDVGFVTQASQARLTPTQRYIFHSILSIFGNDMKDNISVMATFADGGKLQVIDAIKEAKVPYSRIFRFNNSALFHQEGSGDDDAIFLSKMFWDMGVKSLEQYFLHLQKAQPVSLQLTREVLNNRHHLEAILEGTHKEISAGLAKIDEIRQEEIVLQKHKSDVLANKDFTYKVNILKDKRIELILGEHVTNCLTCNKTCHYPCYITDDNEKYKCFAMENQSSPTTVCGVCPGKCSWNVHFNRPYRIETYSDVETRTSADLKERYDKAIHGQNKHEAMVICLEEDVKKRFCKFVANVQKVREISERLDEIALQKNPLTDLQYLDILIEGEHIEKREGYLDRIKYFSEAKQQAQFLNAMKAQGKLPDQNMESSEGRSVWRSIWTSLCGWFHS